MTEKSEVGRFAINFAKTNQKITEISENFENYSILFNRVLSRPPPLARPSEASRLALAAPAACGLPPPARGSSPKIF